MKNGTKKMKSFIIAVSLLIAASEGNQFSAAIGQLANEITDFSQDLYQELATNESTFCCSPFSAHVILTAAWIGAQGITSVELGQALGVDTFNDVASVNQVYNDLIGQITSVPDVEVFLANGLFANPSKSILPQYIDDITTYYHATASNYDPDAVGGPEKEINEFVEDTTDGQITDILPPNTITDNTVVVLINALKLNATWLDPFSVDQTAKGNFNSPNGVIQVDMMNDQRTVKIKKTDNDVAVAELPFDNEDFALYIAMPQNPTGMSDLENSLTSAEALEQLLSGLQETRVKFSIPKFNIESSFLLTQPLKGLGIVQAFDPNLANFDGISNTSDIYITSMLHKAVIKITETGTIAAAATAIVVGTTALQEPPTESFLVDKPFLFYLRHKSMKCTIFQGKYSG